MKWNDFACMAMLGCCTFLAPEHGLTQGSKPRGGTKPLTATFRDASGATPDRIKSDGLGTYIDNVQKVQVYIESGAHNADFHIWLGNTKGVRTLSLDFAQCVSPGDCSAPFAQGLVFRNTVMRTLRADLPGMAIGETASILLSVGFDAPDPATGEIKHWFLRFVELDTETGCQGSTVAITRTALDTWVIEADGLDVACLLSQEDTPGTKIFRGRFVMPLQVTAKLK